MRNLVRWTEWWLLVSPALTSAGADTSYRLNLNEHFGGREASDFDQCRTWEIAAKELLSGAPHFGVVLDVDDVDGHFYNVRHCASSGLDKVSDLAEDHFCLLVFTAALDGYAVAAAGNRAGDEKDIADAQSIGPSARRRLCNMRARDSFDLHAFILFLRHFWLRPTSANYLFNLVVRFAPRH